MDSVRCSTRNSVLSVLAPQGEQHTLQPGLASVIVRSMLCRPARSGNVSSSDVSVAIMGERRTRDSGSERNSNTASGGELRIT